MTRMLNATLGEYQLVHFLGAGGMGEVYRAVHSKIGRVVAVKMLTQIDSQSQAAERFLNEARIQASLHHPNIATLYDFFEFNGRPCIIMEYVDGQTLAERIHARGRLSLSEAVSIFQTLVSAVTHLHSRGIVHRDIKPNNIKVSSAGAVKLLDFGIAKAGISPKLTMTGRYVGTLPYLSPEALIGKPADARTDVWALGVLLYEMVTGKLPFAAAAISEIITRISRATFAPASMLNPALPREVDAIISRCLKPNPAERYQSAEDMWEDIQRLAAVTSMSQERGVKPHHPAPHAGAVLTAAATHWPLLITTATLILVVVFGVLMPPGKFVVKPDARPFPSGYTRHDGSTLPAPEPSSHSNGNRVRCVQVDVVEGPAEVYRNGERVSITPHAFTGAPGEQIRFMLRREGYYDKEVTFDVPENDDAYIYRLEKMQNAPR